MRQKELKLVITFHTTAEAIAMEKACKENQVSGRLIPVPRQISSGCGLSWAMPAKEEDSIKQFMIDHTLQWESVGTYMI
jgi:hypothetical protein